MAEHNNILPDDALLRRSELAPALTRLGYKIAHSTLSTMAVRGGGPPFRYFGKFPVYRWGDAVAWANGRLGKLISSTSEAA